MLYDVLIIMFCMSAVALIGWAMFAPDESIARLERRLARVRASFARKRAALTAFLIKSALRMVRRQRRNVRSTPTDIQPVRDRAATTITTFNAEAALLRAMKEERARRKSEGGNIK